MGNASGFPLCVWLVFTLTICFYDPNLERCKPDPRISPASSTGLMEVSQDVRRPTAPRTTRCISPLARVTLSIGDDKRPGSSDGR